jgi:flagellar biosynthesis/type III secretory pathway protein FliH
MSKRTVRAPARTLTDVRRRNSKAALAKAPDEDPEILALRAEFQQLQQASDRLRKQHDPLESAFYAIGKLEGREGAEEWAEESGFWAVNTEISDLRSRASFLVERMILLRPQTPAGVAAVAASIKEDQPRFWKKPEKDRDWDVSLVTRFIDGLVERGSSEAHS